ncbi:TonB-dependent receptor domain-containing protein [Novosphingobium sp.]|uniref:TonB-dependent receptor domain-containing protein n=1 Tax=Novosphingobium sp. TaxID=1874826 RepID=UPI002FDB62B2
MTFRVSSILLAGAATVALSTPAFAEENGEGKRITAWEASRTHNDDTMIVTGVAKARDRLDSATSTSSMTDNEIAKISPRSLSDLFRNIPGIRSEASAGEANNNYTIRGLPLVSTGAKYLQFQEDGLPVLEFGDILGLGSDVFLRPDFNVAQIESIRGGSASTFASNAPGAVVNLISQTGEVEGGSIQASAGLNYDNYRTDFDYGGHLSDTVRFHVGGFYREGNGPRHVGYTADRGGQVKFNITKEFNGGYVRLYGKVLDDRGAQYTGMPIAVTGTDSNPKYESLPNFSVTHDSVLSRNISAFPVLDPNNNLSEFDVHNGGHARAKSLGLETRFSVGEWSITERMRYSDQSGDISFLYPLAAIPAVAVPAAFGAPGGSLVYAGGPLKGQTITNPLTLNGNGLVLFSSAISTPIISLNNFTNDLRTSRVWNVGGGDFTGTAGVYLAHQDTKFSRALVDVLQDVNGNGNSALIDIIDANGNPVTQNGAVDFVGPAPALHSAWNMEYRVLAPYGSFNFHKGKVSVGASVRVDTGKVNGNIRTNSPGDVTTIDVNNDSVITNAERSFAFVPLANNMPVNYRYHYVSYSGSVNYRASQNFSTFARYSRGARAAADRILFTPAVNPVDGSLVQKSAAYDPVKQAEVGLKYRANGLFLNLTGFWAKVRETNTQLKPGANGVTVLQLVNRSYRAYGAEFEGGVRHGPFSLTAGATLTNAKITAADDPALVGNTPRHQAGLIFQVMPQYETELFTIGADVIGTTRSYAQDENKLRMPGYATVNAFVQIRPMERVELSLNASNLFNVTALTDVMSSSMPASGVTIAQALYGRTISSSVRFFF